jgi:tRNA 2-thiouridine synthesizing protein A
MTDEPRPVSLDVCGLEFPLPGLGIRNALRKLAPGTRLVGSCSDPLAVVDIPHMVRQEGDISELQGEAEGGGMIFQLRRAAR